LELFQYQQSFGGHPSLLVTNENIVFGCHYRLIGELILGNRMWGDGYTQILGGVPYLPLTVLGCSLLQGGRSLPKSQNNIISDCSGGFFLQQPNEFL